VTATNDIEINSYSLFIRDAMLQRIRLMPFFVDFAKFGRSRRLSIQPDGIPYVGVYLCDETMVPDGDYNAGDIRFTHALRIGFSVIVYNNDEDNTEDQLDGAFWALMNGLLCDATLTNLFETDIPGNAVIEGFSRGTRRHFYSVTSGSEQPIGELQMDLTCVLRTRWAPTITDDLKVIHVETSFPIAGTEEEKAGIQQVTSVYDIEFEE
jgi:hypothetical protein